MAIKIDKPYSIIATIKAQKPSIMRMVVRDAIIPNTVYIDRVFPSEDKLFVGEKTFEFPMPYSFKNKVVLEVSDISGNQHKVVIVNTKKVPLKQYPLDYLDDNTRRFVKFALWFCLNAGVLKVGETYNIPDNEIEILYKNGLYNYKTNERLSTPARYEINNKFIELDANQVKNWTFCRRFMLVMHEFYHSIYTPRKLSAAAEETACDLAAINVALALGFSNIECMYAFAKLFEYNLNREPWLIKEQEMRIENIYKHVTNYSHSKKYR